ncbi:MAG: hypothetical protein H0Z24_08655 [Thermosipho sp. (in: Bacteria)]|nr:hypothetical protein [Thermosipho sp. (in: thermotogales)]
MDAKHLNSVLAASNKVLKDHFNFETEYLAPKLGENPLIPNKMHSSY